MGELAKREKDLIPLQLQVSRLLYKVKQKKDLNESVIREIMEPIRNALKYYAKGPLLLEIIQLFWEIRFLVMNL